MQVRQQVLLMLLGLVVLVGKLLLATCSMPMRRAMVADRRQGEAGETGAGLAAGRRSGLDGAPFGSGLTGRLAGELRELLAELAGTA